MPNVFRMIDKASEKPFNMAVGAAVYAAKEWGRRPVSTSILVLAGGMALKAVDDHSMRRASYKRSMATYISEHRPHLHAQHAVPEIVEPVQQVEQPTQESVADER